MCCFSLDPGKGCKKRNSPLSSIFSPSKGKTRNVEGRTEDIHMTGTVTSRVRSGYSYPTPNTHMLEHMEHTVLA